MDRFDFSNEEEKLPRDIFFAEIITIRGKNKNANGIPPYAI